MINFYDLHSDPKSLDHHDDAHEQVPKLVWHKYLHKDGVKRTNIAEMEKREHIWAKEAYTAYFYSSKFLKGRFEIGEEAIAKNGEYSFYYARYILKSPFELGELAIKKSLNFLTIMH